MTTSARVDFDDKDGVAADHAEVVGSSLMSGIIIFDAEEL
jgi:hypothetical protein